MNYRLFPVLGGLAGIALGVLVGIALGAFVRHCLTLPNNPPPPRVRFEIEVDPVTGQGRVATINNSTGYAVTNLVLRGTTVRFDLVAPK